jgi:hypothetical protein
MSSAVPPAPAATAEAKRAWSGTPTDMPDDGNVTAPAKLGAEAAPWAGGPDDDDAATSPVLGVETAAWADNRSNAAAIRSKAATCLCCSGGSSWRSSSGPGPKAAAAGFFLIALSLPRPPRQGSHRSLSLLARFRFRSADLQGPTMSAIGATVLGAARTPGAKPGRTRHRNRWSGAAGSGYFAQVLTQ